VVNDVLQGFKAQSENSRQCIVKTTAQFVVWKVLVTQPGKWSVETIFYRATQINLI